MKKIEISAEDYLDKLDLADLEELKREVDSRFEEKVRLRSADFNQLYLSVRALNCLKKVGVNNMLELSKISSNEVLKIHNIGVNTMREIAKEMERFGLSWDWKDTCKWR